MTMFALGGVAISTWGPRLPSIRGSLHAQDGTIGLLLACVTVGSLAGLAASSALLSVLGPRRAIAATLALVSLGIAVLGYGAGEVHSTALTSVGFVCVGFGIGALDVMINVQGSAVEISSDKTLMPLLHAAWSLGAILGSGIGAGAAALEVPFTWQFALEAVLILAAGVVSVRFIPSTLEPTSPHRPAIAMRVRLWLRGWGDRRLLAIGLVMLGVELGEGTSNSWLTLAVRDGHHQTDVVAALFFVAFASGETVTRVFGGPIVDRIGRVNTVRVTASVGVVGLLLFVLAGPAWLVLIGTVLWSVGVSMGFPLGMSAAADSGSNPAARVSVVASVGYLANLGGPPAIGLLSESVGLLNSLWLVAAFLVLAVIAAKSLSVPQRSATAHDDD